jgi:hypothetical protein
MSEKMLSQFILTGLVDGTGTLLVTWVPKVYALGTNLLAPF